jgi:hypothetical protein
MIPVNLAKKCKELPAQASLRASSAKKLIETDYCPSVK